MRQQLQAPYQLSTSIKCWGMFMYVMSLAMIGVGGYNIGKSIDGDILKEKPAMLALELFLLGLGVVVNALLTAGGYSNAMHRLFANNTTSDTTTPLLSAAGPAQLTAASTPSV